LNRRLSRSSHYHRRLGQALRVVRGTYDRFAYIEERTGAFEALAVLIEALLRPPEAAVADLASTRSKRRR